VKPATDLTPVGSATFVWQDYDPAVKADLWSTAMVVGSVVYFVDPIGLEQRATQRLVADRTVAGIFVTNENHVRSAPVLAKQFSAQVLAHHELANHETFADVPVTALSGGRAIAGGALRIIGVPGAPAGEIAIFHDSDGGEMIVGDALINFPPHGFTFLPNKYCSNPRVMRRSLTDLLEFSFERILFAHGAPIMQGARGKLEQLIATAE
jgi:glyoxylase-like metal-dependent hydrolase (beta-lactamase superfamily II)